MRGIQLETIGEMVAQSEWWLQLIQSTPLLVTPMPPQRFGSRASGAMLHPTDNTSTSLSMGGLKHSHEEVGMDRSHALLSPGDLFLGEGGADLWPLSDARNAAHSMFDEMAVEKVVWDEELQPGFDSHGLNASSISWVGWPNAVQVGHIRHQ